MNSGIVRDLDLASACARLNDCVLLLRRAVLHVCDLGRRLATALPDSLDSCDDLFVFVIGLVVLRGLVDL